jgi:hypothetical protein
VPYFDVGKKNTIRVNLLQFMMYTAISYCMAQNIGVIVKSHTRRRYKYANLCSLAKEKCPS